MLHLLASVEAHRRSGQRSVGILRHDTGRRNNTYANRQWILRSRYRAAAGGSVLSSVLVPKEFTGVQIVAPDGTIKGQLVSTRGFVRLLCRLGDGYSCEPRSADVQSWHGHAAAAIGGLHCPSDPTHASRSRWAYTLVRSRGHQAPPSPRTGEPRRRIF